MPGAVADLDALGVDAARPAARPGSATSTGARSGRRALPARARARRASHGAARRALRGRRRRPACRSSSARWTVADARTTDGVLVDGEPARYLLAADGLHSPVRRLVGLDGPAAGGRRRFGLRRHVAQRALDAVRRGALVAAGGGLRDAGRRRLRRRRGPGRRRAATSTTCSTGFPRARASGWPGPRRRGCWAPARCGSASRAASPAGCCSSATPSGYVDALTGEGIALGLAQARAAVTAVLSGDPSAYERAGGGCRWRHNLLTHGLLAATRPRRPCAAGSCPRPTRRRGCSAPRSTSSPRPA